LGGCAFASKSRRARQKSGPAAGEGGDRGAKWAIGVGSGRVVSLIDRASDAPCLRC
jgi:hypothetical protein